MYALHTKMVLLVSSKGSKLTRTYGSSGTPVQLLKKCRYAVPDRTSTL